MALTPTEALAEINRAGTQGNFRISRHAVQRMRERKVKWDDIKHGLMMTTSCQLQPNDCWVVPARDLDGDVFVIVVALEDGVLVVTVRDV
jgi:hypothetical protein